MRTLLMAFVCGPAARCVMPHDWHCEQSAQSHCLAPRESAAGALTMGGPPQQSRWKHRAHCEHRALLVIVLHAGPLRQPAQRFRSANAAFFALAAGRAAATAGRSAATFGWRRGSGFRTRLPEDLLTTARTTGSSSSKSMASSSSSGGGGGAAATTASSATATAKASSAAVRVLLPGGATCSTMAPRGMAAPRSQSAICSANAATSASASASASQSASAFLAFLESCLLTLLGLRPVS
mmetsp:Transcript_27870/g.93759  ORF Transcript_27870/g.93759 Transcript_27870/m.93759 type:complete len:238 (-) Transcript_27870:510-1223(-)